MRDLLKATGASVIPLAKPRSRGSYEQGGIIATGGSGTASKAPMLSWYSSSATIPTNGFPSGVNARESTPDDEQAQLQKGPEDQSQSLGTALRGEITSDAGTNQGSTEIRTNGGGSSGGDADGREGGASEDASEVELKLRVISAAMHAVSVALSALSTLQDGHDGGGGDTQGTIDDGANDGSGGRGFENPVLLSDTGSSGNRGTASSGDYGGGGGRPDFRNTFEAGDDSATATPSHPQVIDQDAVPVAATTTAVTDRRGEESAADRFSPPDGDDPRTAGALEGNPAQSDSESAAAVPAGTNVEAAAAVGAPDMMESKAEGVGGYGRELARAAGTPTVDAIGGDVHLVAIVAGKRSLTRLLHFVDLVRGLGGVEAWGGGKGCLGCCEKEECGGEMGSGGCVLGGGRTGI